MPGKKHGILKNTCRKPEKNPLLAISIILMVLVAVSLASFLSGSSVSGMATKSSKPAGSGIKIYDVNIPGSFFTFRNLGKNPLNPGEIHIFINGKEVMCVEELETMETGQIALCTTPAVNACKTIKVISPVGDDVVECG